MTLNPSVRRHALWLIEGYNSFRGALGKARARHGYGLRRTFGGPERTSIVLKYLELKTGYSDNGPAWVARVTLSKSGRTVYFNGRALKRGHGVGANHFDLETGHEYWISSVKRNGSDRHWAGSGKVTIEAGAVREYLELAGRSELDASRFEVVPDFPPTDPTRFHALENRKLQS